MSVYTDTVRLMMKYSSVQKASTIAYPSFQVFSNFKTILQKLPKENRVARVVVFPQSVLDLLRVFGSKLQPNDGQRCLQIDTLCVRAWAALVSWRRIVPV